MLPKCNGWGIIELVFLGTGGAATTPKVGFLRKICQEARKRGRFIRNGPSVFMIGASVLFDTLEDVGQEPDRHISVWIKAVNVTFGASPTNKLLQRAVTSESSILQIIGGVVEE